MNRQLTNIDRRSAVPPVTAKNPPEMRVNASDPGYTATGVSQHSGHQTVTEGTDATIALATVGPDGPTGELHDRRDRVTY